MFDCGTQSKTIERLEYDYRAFDWLRRAAYAKAIKQAVNEVELEKAYESFSCS